MNNIIKIVLVEDASADAALILKMLTTIGEENFVVNHVTTISEAKNLLSEHSYDLVLLDLSLPDGNGLNNIVAIKKVRPRIPIIVLTANNDYPFSIRAIKHGAQDYLVKGSFNSMLLGRSIRYAVERSKQQTEVNRYLKKVEHLNAMLHKLNEDKSEFMIIASHDMKNPLGVIYSLSESMLSEIETISKEELRELLSIINQSSYQLIDLIKNLLNVQAIESGKVETNNDKFNLEKLVRSVLNNYKQKIRIKNLSVFFSPDAQCPIISDQDLMRQIFDNLISNAIKYSTDGKNIFIELKPSGNNVVCSIKDEGPGIKISEKEKVFTKFGKLSNRPSQGESSTGIGLFSAKKFAELLNCKIWFESVEQDGTTFFIEIPFGNEI